MDGRWRDGKAGSIGRSGASSLTKRGAGYDRRRRITRGHEEVCEGMFNRGSQCQHAGSPMDPPLPTMDKRSGLHNA